MAVRSGARRRGRFVGNQNLGAGISITTRNAFDQRRTRARRLRNPHCSEIGGSGVPRPSRRKRLLALNAVAVFRSKISLCPSAQQEIEPRARTSAPIRFPRRRLRAKRIVLRAKAVVVKPDCGSDVRRRFGVCCGASARRSRVPVVTASLPATVVGPAGHSRSPPGDGRSGGNGLG